jgi:hypothetical protein
MNKDIYDQTVINFHSQLLIKEFTEHGVSHKTQVSGFVDSAMEAFVSNFNDSLAKRFLSDIEHKVTPKASLNEILEQYPTQFFNFKDGQRLVENKSQENVDQFLRLFYSLGDEMTKIKNETSGIPPRLLDAAKKNITERFDVILDTFGAALSTYGQYSIDIGINMVKSVLHTCALPEFNKITNNLLNQPISEKIINRLKYEEAKNPSENNNGLIQVLTHLPAKTMKP